MAGRADLQIYQGDDYSAVVTVASNGTPPDQVLAGYTAQAQIRDGPADDNPVVLVEIATVVTSPDISLTIPKETTATLSGEYAWDLQVISPAGMITTILAGGVMVTQEVTREIARGARR